MDSLRGIFPGRGPVWGASCRTPLSPRQGCSASCPPRVTSDRSAPFVPVRIPLAVGLKTGLPSPVHGMKGASSMWKEPGRPLMTLTLAGALVLVGCDDSPTDPPLDPQPSAVEVIAESAALTYIGAETSLSAVVRDDTGAPIEGATVTWSSSEDAVVSVSTEGQATAVSSGSATITATSGTASGNVTLDVIQEPDSIAVSEEEILLVEIGATEQLEVTLLDAGGTPIEDAEITWSSSDEVVATVSEDGVVTAVGSGTAVVTAESGDHSATVEVQVQPAASIQMDPADLSLTSIGATGTVTATLRDAEGAAIVGVPLNWSSSDEDVVTVDADGTVEAIGVGTATISAGIGSIEGSTSVTVSQTADAIELTPAELTLVTAGATAQLTAVVMDAGGTEIEGAVATWTSSDPAVATVDSEGEVTAIANGTAVITAQSGEATATSTVTVDIDD
ncbi:MAG: hypothetical protein EA350_01845 [Gemmatimonadales bacterium]|nr:MAG: hypothetical protein EA350_01845 [Gemmatimonadales bacterium]